MSCVEILDHYYGGVTTSARRKLCRGIEQVKTLCREADAFERGDPCSHRVQREQTKPNEITNRCFAALRQPLDLEWPLRAGEAVQNLRSALDHVVYAASRGNRSYFPIYTDPCEFQVLGKKHLARLPAAMRTIVKDAQPYNNAAQDPTIDPLEQLRVLSNTDKHRALATVVASVSFEWVGVPTGVEIAWKDYASSKIIGEGETYISTFVATYAPEVVQVDVEPGFRFKVLIENEPIESLKGMAIRTFEVVIECETGEPPIPFGYPLL